MVAIFIFVLGACVGSFLNVCIWRLPRDESIVRPRSHCPVCNHKLAWYENIPVLSYFPLGGKCRYCKSPISLRYLTVELTTAFLFLGLFKHFGLNLKSVPLFVIYTALACALVVVTFIDFRHRIIPNEITLSGMGIGLILSFIFPLLHNSTSRWSSIFNSLLGILVGGGTIYLTGLLGDLIFKKESMGGGDVKLLAMLGAFLGWKLALLTFFIAPLFGSLVGIYLKVRCKVEHIPYGPYLSLGAIISIIWGEEIIKWILY